ncbi:MAG: restriction endonuclease subunit M [Leeuwenhoekiella sp.]|nr:MAG: restriction endonuclease subunit M [Leeuwenhoekiella sp.]
MALFQNSVLNKYLKAQDEKAVAKAYKNFSGYFLHPEIQENIRKSKEEQFQATFLNELFVGILGYTLNPNPGYNLTTEFKNEKNNRKADGAILKNESATGVIELKGTNTKDLESIRRQAFDYKANQKGCVYVVTSNFEKLRFYINDATEFEEFNLFELTPERFALLYLCLQHDNLMADVPLKIKEASIAEEEKITKEFYKDYSVFKRELFRDLVKRNVRRIRSNRQSELEDATTAELTQEERAERTRLQKNIKLTLFKKSQKLIDRFLFIFFAEDRGLLPPNSTLKILDEFEKLKEMDAHVPLYDRFKLYFNYLDQGRKGTEKHAEIYAYNGGLFKPDAILDQLVIDDELLLTHTRKLANYDFESQVDVNILGHIFENSLNEIESVNAEIEGDTFDKQTSKRKKDGVFYTPKYITKYIVENTVGKLCEEKKAELGFEEAEYFKSRKGRNKDTLKKLVAILDDYREWLLQITICDPACGSGAFLNQALDFLIKEHRYIDELKAKVLGGGLVFADIENTILENNIYGVDLNEESVEIAKLSLWLRTAQPRRKLNDLSSNIKCGNSLIDSKAVAGDKAFKWETQFAAIFEKGGFDVVIGNPPYLGGRNWKDSDGRNYDYLLSKYRVAEYQFDMYVVFWERGLFLTKESGVLGFITPITWLNNQKTKKLREFILKETQVLQLIDFSNVDVFKDAVVMTMIGIIRKNFQNKENFVKTFKAKSDNLIIDFEYIKQSAWVDNDLNIINTNLREKDIAILQRIESKGTPLEEYCDVKFGIKIYETGKGNPPQKKADSKNNIYESTFKVDNTYRPYLEGKDINTYQTLYQGRWLKYGENLAAPRSPDLFEGPRLLVRRIVGKNLISTFIESDFVTSQLLQIVKPILEVNLKEILAILNSNLMAFYFRKKYNRIDKTFPEIRVYELRSLPVLSKSPKEILLSNAVDLILKQNASLIALDNKYKTFFTSQYKLEKVSRKLENWHELEFGAFIKELNKSIKANNKLREKAAKEAGGQAELVEALTKKDEFEWMSLFEENKKKAQDLQTQINQTEHEIDQMVYELYGLTEEEIAIVENS